MKRAFFAALTFVIGLFMLTPAAAASPRLVLQCGAPTHGIITCRLSGQGFHSRERLYIFYEVVTSAKGTTVARMYSRGAYTTSAGSFRRPSFRVSGDHDGLFSYRVTAMVVGSRGDQASIQASGQP